MSGGSARDVKRELSLHALGRHFRHDTGARVGVKLALSMMWQTRERYFGLALSTLLALACASQEAAKRDQVQMLQRIALEEAKSGQATSARSLLLEAERLGLEAGLETDPLVTRTRMALGAIYANNFKDEGRGVAYMREALSKNPEAKLPTGMASPRARRALAIARGRNPDAANDASAVEPVSGSGFADEVGAGTSETTKVAKEEAPPAPKKEHAPDAKTVMKDELLAAAGPPPPPEEPAVETVAEAEPIHCPIPLEAPPDHDVVLKCTIGGASVRSTRLVLYYRPAGTERFTQVPMPRLGQGRSFQGVIPSGATKGKSLQFYVETRGTMKVNYGSSESPNLLIVREGAPPVGGEAVVASAAASESSSSSSESSPPADEVVKSSRDRDDNPLAALDAARHLSMLERRPAGHFWAAFGLGKGYGWQPGGKLEFRNEREITAGSLPGGLLQVLPEVGYQLMDRLSVSAQLRIEYVPTTGSGDPRGGSPANRATSILFRGAYTFSDKKLQPLATACIGGGDGFRLRVPNDRGVELVRSDTVRGGPLVAGVGGGIIYNFNQRMALPAEARLLVGFPSSAIVMEIGTSFAYTF